MIINIIQCTRVIFSSYPIHIQIEVHRRLGGCQRTFSELHCPTRMGTMGPKSTVLTVAFYIYDNQRNTVYESDPSSPTQYTFG
jgi:hypothetical protein